MGLRQILLLSASLGLGIAAGGTGQALADMVPVPPKPPRGKAAPVEVAQAPATTAPQSLRPGASMERSRASVPATPGLPHTLAEALAMTYANQPALQAERAKLRATDENVPTALAGWRPTVVLAGTAGYGDGTSRQYLATSSFPSNVKSQTDRLLGTAQATVTQNVYTGGRTQANINRAKNQVMAERANLISQEETSFTNTVNAYVGAR